MSKSSNLLNELEEELSAARSEFDVTFDQLRTDIRQLVDAHGDELSRIEEQMLALQSRQQDLAQESTQHAAAAQERAAELSTAQGEAAELSAAVHALPSTSAGLDAEYRAAQSELSDMEAALAAKREEAQTVFQELTRGVEMFRMLGLVFEHLPDERLRLVFTQIDAAAPEARYSFCVRVDEAGRYTVSDVQPAVPGLDAKVQQLNASDNFAQFALSMRQAFVDTAAL